jgi:dynactin complex subunit
MTIDEIAKQMHISKKTLYARLKEREISPDALRDEQRQLTSEGMSIIASLFPGKRVCGDNGNVLETMENPANTGSAARETASETEKTNRENVLETENETLKREVELLREALEDARKQRDQMFAALQTAQETAQRLLPAAQEEKRGFLVRLFSRKK